MQDRRRTALRLLRALRALPVLAPTGAVLPAHGQTAPTPAASAPKGTETIRPALAAPLQAAKALLQQRKAQEALAKLKEAEAVGGLTRFETMVVARNRALAAQAAGDRSALVADLGWSSVAGLPRGAPPADAVAALKLIEDGVAKGGLRRASETRLHLAMAQIAAARKEAARKTLAELAAAAAADPIADAVRLWALWAAAALQVLTRAAGARAAPSVLRP